MYSKNDKEGHNSIYVRTCPSESERSRHHFHRNLIQKNKPLTYNLTHDNIHHLSQIIKQIPNIFQSDFGQFHTHVISVLVFLLEKMFNVFLVINPFTIVRLLLDPGIPGGGWSGPDLSILPILFPP